MISLITGQGIFVVITFLTFGEAQIIGNNRSQSDCFWFVSWSKIGYFASTGKMAEMFGWRKQF